MTKKLNTQKREKSSEATGGGSSKQPKSILRRKSYSEQEQIEIDQRGKFENDQAEWDFTTVDPILKRGVFRPQMPVYPKNQTKIKFSRKQKHEVFFTKHAPVDTSDNDIVQYWARMENQKEAKMFRQQIQTFEKTQKQNGENSENGANILMERTSSAEKEKILCPVCNEVKEKNVILWPCLHHVCRDCAPTNPITIKESENQQVGKKQIGNNNAKGSPVKKNDKKRKSNGGADAKIEGNSKSGKRKIKWPKCKSCNRTVTGSAQVRGCPFVCSFKIKGKSQQFVINWEGADDAARRNTAA